MGAKCTCCGYDEKTKVGRQGIFQVVAGVNKKDCVGKMFESAYNDVYMMWEMEDKTVGECQKLCTDTQGCRGECPHAHDC